MTLKVRFAPSPTGHLHVGNARIALANWLYAHKNGGKFLLRIDDTDLARSKQEYEDGIIRDLTWLGLTWDEFARQSERTPSHTRAIAHLKDMGRLYPCYETPEELEFKRRRLMARGLPPVYDREALTLTDAQRADYEAQGRQPHWRFKLVSGDIAWDDLIRGPVRYAADHLSDPVLIRADGMALYTITSVVDDMELDVHTIIRGEDHVTNTAVQIQLIEALADLFPGRSHQFTFAHIPLLVGKTGEGLSKRFDSLSLHSLREMGIEPMAINSLLFALGSRDNIEPHTHLSDLVAQFSFEKYSRATPKFDEDELKKLSEKVVHALSFDQVQERLTARHSPVTRDFWESLKGNLTTVEDIDTLWDLCHGTVQGTVTDEAFMNQAIAALPPEPWDTTTMRTWADALKQQTGRKGKDLFMPLRLGLTGQEHGPDMNTLLPLIGRERAVKRLKGEMA